MGNNEFKTQNIFYGPVGAIQQGNLNSAFILQQEDTDEIEGLESSIVYDEAGILIKDGGYEDYSCEIDDQEGILFEVDADNPINIMLLDTKNYERWRNEGVVDSYYKMYEQKSFLKRQFWPEEAGEYILVLHNPEAKKRAFNLTVTSLTE